MGACAFAYLEDRGSFLGTRPVRSLCPLCGACRMRSSSESSGTGAHDRMEQRLAKLLRATTAGDGFEIPEHINALPEPLCLYVHDFPPAPAVS
jgi:hypothetical protein